MDKEELAQEYANSMELFPPVKLRQERIDAFIKGFDSRIDPLPKNYWFTNEHNQEVTVLTTHGEWCVVSEEGKSKPYVLPLELVMAIYESGTLK